MTKGLVLVAEDSPTIARLHVINLEASGYQAIVASNGAEAFQLATERCPDVVLADVMMPEMDGLELTRRLRNDPRTAGVCIIMVTAKILSADRLAGLTAGADDYLVKPFDPAELLARVRGAIHRMRMLRSQSPLTGLPGNTRIEEEIEGRILRDEAFVVLYADLDHFKAYNDYYGFARGDQVLKMTARLLEEVAFDHGGPGVFVGHVGGDDFVVLAAPAEGAAIAAALADRFDREVPLLYDAEDLARGYIENTNRQGQLHRAPLAAVSVGVTGKDRTFAHYAEAVATATEMKAFAKSRSPGTLKSPVGGSAWAVDQRSK